MAKKKKRPRARRRDAQRALAKLISDREKLAALEDGGSSERPLTVRSASVVESTAAGLGCLHCESTPRVEGHAATRVGERVQRQVRLRCARCGAERTVFVEVVPVRAN